MIMDELQIKVINENELDNALSLVWKVFQEYEAPDYNQKGIDEFGKSIHDPNFLAKLTIYGAFTGSKLVGLIATRSGGSHIALLFVDGEYHRKGIGRQLFHTVIEKCPTAVMTVNSSPYAVPVYHRLGFHDTNTEQVVNGLRFTPMEYHITGRTK
jgi:GNAT superfamily N-acetyltransferase